MDGREESFLPEGAHRLELVDRERLYLSGVEEVERFDEESILLTTNRGGLEIQGRGLHIEQLSLDGGELTVEGEITQLQYDARLPEKGGLLSRLFGL